MEVWEEMKRKADYIMRNIGGENLLVPLGAQVMRLNGVIALNDTAVCLWELLEDERSLDELIATVMKRFDVADEDARSDVQDFVEEISQLGLLEP